MKGFLFAIAVVFLWALLNVLNRFFLVQYEIDIIVFTAYMLFSSGVSLMLIGQRLSAEDWHRSVKYSWLYTMMQIIRSYFIISSFVYISSSETSLLFNIEIVFTFILAWAIFHRPPKWGDYVGSFIILAGFIAFVASLNHDIGLAVTLTVAIAALASCVRSIVVEKTTLNTPGITVRQKCGVSGYTLFYGGLSLLILLIGIAVFKWALSDSFPDILTYLPNIHSIVHAPTVLSACFAGLVINAAATYMYYAALKHATSEMFMSVRAFQPVVTYGLEAFASLFYFNMLPDLTTEDLKLTAVIIFGALFILFVPHSAKRNAKNQFPTPPNSV